MDSNYSPPSPPESSHAFSPKESISEGWDEFIEDADLTPISSSLPESLFHPKQESLPSQNSTASLLEKNLNEHPSDHIMVESLWEEVESSLGKVIDASMANGTTLPIRDDLTNSSSCTISLTSYNEDTEKPTSHYAIQKTGGTSTTPTPLLSASPIVCASILNTGFSVSPTLAMVTSSDSLDSNEYEQSSLSDNSCQPFSEDSDFSDSIILNPFLQTSSNYEDLLLSPTSVSPTYNKTITALAIWEAAQNRDLLKVSSMTTELIASSSCTNTTTTISVSFSEVARIASNTGHGSLIKSFHNDESTPPTSVSKNNSEIASTTIIQSNDNVGSDTIHNKINPNNSASLLPTPPSSPVIGVKKKRGRKPKVDATSKLAIVGPDGKIKYRCPLSNCTT